MAEPEVLVRVARPGDGTGIARIHRDNAAYYATLAPEAFRVPALDGHVEFLDPKPADTSDATLSLVAEIDGTVAGFLEARLVPPLATARWQTDPALAETRLFINALGTAPEHHRKGVGSRLVAAAEEWGRTRGATFAECDTYAESPLSIPFWETGVGYRRHAVILRKRL